jgi:hypothetical protein
MMRPHHFKKKRNDEAQRLSLLGGKRNIWGKKHKKESRLNFKP